jgi:hypothetical protein
MAYLDVSPMISSLRSAPDEFEVIRGALHHFPSRHKFWFDPEGHVTVDALCDCAMLAVLQEQELHHAFQQWHVAYWRPLEINKEFASHFRRPNALQRVYRKLMSRLRRALIQDGVPELANAARSEVRVRP